MTVEERARKDSLTRYIKLSAKKKLEWLYQMNMFSNKFATKKYRAVWLKLREAR